MTQQHGWWDDTVEPRVSALARRICSRHGVNPDSEVLPYEAQGMVTASGVVTLTPKESIVPLWTCYVALAKAALELRDEGDVAEVLLLDDGKETPLDGFVDAPPASTDGDATWRKEVGLDGTETV